MPEQPRPVPDNTRLLRRVKVPDWISEGGQLSSATFIDRRSGFVSVFMADLVTPTQLLEGHPGDRVVEIEARVLRTLGYEPMQDCPESNPPHVHFKSPTKSAARKMRDAARWVI